MTRLVASRDSAWIWARHFGIYVPEIPFGYAAAFSLSANGTWSARVYPLQHDPTSPVEFTGPQWGGRP